MYTLYFMLEAPTTAINRASSTTVNPNTFASLKAKLRLHSLTPSRFYTIIQFTHLAMYMNVHSSNKHASVTTRKPLTVWKPRHRIHVECGGLPQLRSSLIHNKTAPGAMD